MFHTAVSSFQLTAFSSCLLVGPLPIPSFLEDNSELPACLPISPPLPSTDRSNPRLRIESASGGDSLANEFRVATKVASEENSLRVGTYLALLRLTSIAGDSFPASRRLIIIDVFYEFTQLTRSENVYNSMYCTSIFKYF